MEPSRAPTMNIKQINTSASDPDPMKKAFRKGFDLLPNSARGHVVAFVGEFIGTTSILFFAFAGGSSGAAASNSWEKQGQAEKTSTKPPGFTPQLLLFIAFSAGFSLVVHCWIFFRVSGGLFNPMVSLGMLLIGAITWARCALLMLAQFLGAICASYAANALFAGGLHTDTHLNKATSPAQGVMIEMLLTALLTFTIFMLAAEKHESTHLAPLGIGLALFLATLAGFFWTGASLNPFRSLAPCIVNRSFTSYHWIYWVGPTAGSILAVLIYKLVKALEYERVHEEHQEQSLVAHVQNAPAPTAPLSSINASALAIKNKPDEGPMQTVQVGRLSLSVPADDDAKDVKRDNAQPKVAKKDNVDSKDKKKDDDELPECFAD